jgi:hypothetical protein
MPYLKQLGSVLILAATCNGLSRRRMRGAAHARRGRNTSHCAAPVAPAKRGHANAIPQHIDHRGASGTCAHAIVGGCVAALGVRVRCRTVRTRRSRSTSSQVNPRNSDARKPVKIAVVNIGRSGPAFASIARISSFVGMSTPTRN